MNLMCWRALLAGQPNSDRLMAAGVELGDEQVPLPQVATSARDERKGRHV